jgi:hypothetical protein
MQDRNDKKNRWAAVFGRVGHLRLFGMVAEGEFLPKGAADLSGVEMADSQPGPTQGLIQV